MHIRNLLCVTLLGLSLDVLAAADADPLTLATEAATVSAKEWLKLVDDGKYDESWDAGSTFLQKVITRDIWTNTNMQRMRGSVRLASRKVWSAVPMTTFQGQGGFLQGLPDGEYVMIKYSSKFRPERHNLRSRDLSASGPTEMVETVVMVHDVDGAWKPSLYMSTPGVMRAAEK